MAKRGGETSPPISPADVVCFMGADRGTNIHTYTQTNTNTHMRIYNGELHRAVRAEEYPTLFRNRAFRARAI